MAFYEATFAIKPDVAEEERKELIQEIKNFISDEVKEEVKKVEELGVQSFAYEVEKAKEGFFVTINFRTEPSQLKEIRDFLKAKDQIIRLMIIKGKKLPQKEQLETSKEEEGNLTQDPEIRYTPDGTPVGSFTIAVNRPFTNQKGEREADFIPIVVWREQAERCSEYLTKGSQVAIDGRLQIRSYEDKDGIRRKRAEVIAWRVVFLQRLKKQPHPEDVEDKFENEIEKIPIDEGMEEEA